MILVWVRLTSTGILWVSLMVWHASLSDELSPGWMGISIFFSSHNIGFCDFHIVCWYIYCGVVKVLCSICLGISLAYMESLYLDFRPESLRGCIFGSKMYCFDSLCQFIVGLCFFTLSSLLYCLSHFMQVSIITF